MWVRRLIADAPRTACPHVQGAPGTAPGVLTAWDRHFMCAACLDGDDLLNRTGDDARTCDKCGRLCPADPEHQIRPTWVTHDRVVVLFALCPNCLRKELAS